MPIDPSMLTTGAEWQIDSPAPAADAPVKGTGFGSMLADKLGELSAMQEEAAQGAQGLATGQVTDPTQVVMAVEKARLSMQLASQLRTKGVEAVNDIFHTQV